LKQKSDHLNLPPLTEAKAKRVFGPNTEEESRELALAEAAIRAIRALRRRKRPGAKRKTRAQTRELRSQIPASEHSVRECDAIVQRAMRKIRR
jgi:hypothetical protein